MEGMSFSYLSITFLQHTHVSTSSLSRKKIVLLLMWFEDTIYINKSLLSEAALQMYS